jgi:hypothetical protein
MNRKFRNCAVRRCPMSFAALVFGLAAAMAVSCKKAQDGTTAAGPSPKTSAIAFARALEANDMAAARKVATGTDAEFALAKGFGDIMRSIRSYETVAVDKLGDDAKLSQDQMIDLVDLVAAFDSGVEKIEGDSGTLTIKGGTTFHFKKEGDAWKIDLSFLDSDSQAEASAKAMPEKARVVDGVRKEIEDGTYKRARNALDAIKTRLKEMEGESPLACVTLDIHDLTVAIDRYKDNIGKYPPNLDALVKNPANLEDWKGPYIGDKPDPRPPLDPWKHSYQYAAPGKHNTNGYDLWSAGDGKHPLEHLDNWSGSPN